MVQMMVFGLGIAVRIGHIGHVAVLIVLVADDERYPARAEASAPDTASTTPAATSRRRHALRRTISMSVSLAHL